MRAFMSLAPVPLIAAFANSKPARGFPGHPQVATGGLSHGATGSTGITGPSSLRLAEQTFDDEHMSDRNFPVNREKGGIHAPGRRLDHDEPQAWPVGLSIRNRK
jgi:hypothetical protein